MIIPHVDYDPWMSVDGAPSRGDLHGSIGPEVECELDPKPRRPIGFRMPEREPVPSDPSWMLLP